MCSFYLVLCSFSLAILKKAQDILMFHTGAVCRLSLEVILVAWQQTSRGLNSHRNRENGALMHWSWDIRRRNRFAKSSNRAVF